jgi:CxxC motif-containing protein (DUF1111 family)
MRSTNVNRLLLLSSVLATFGFGAAQAQVAKDPGVRGGAAGAGGFIVNAAHPLTANQQTFFDAGKTDFNGVEEIDEGLGPRFNSTGCGTCHAQPAVGGTSPATNNPQVGVAAEFHNTLPSFITANGPVREARFVKKADGSPDGGVHALFVIAGHPDAPGCAITQENFQQQVNNHNIIFRIPTPIFGMGLVEGIDDTTLKNNIAANNAQKVSLGIFGKFNVSGAANTNGNDGTITRFGWKAQNKSGLLFAGEAYNVEMGISNEIFQTEREENAACQFDSLPNDPQDTDSLDAANAHDAALAATTAIQNFANFQRFSAPPTPVTSYTGKNGAVSSASITRGKQRFIDVGCHLCHTPTLTTNPNTAIAALANQPVNAFSDFAVHAMGPGLADGISQGGAAGDEFRSAPLWGVGQRVFFLHDGRTSDIRAAIEAHFSNGNSQYGPSEANAVIVKFENLGFGDTQDLLNFLRSL